jgi:hypothetical protein
MALIGHFRSLGVCDEGRHVIRLGFCIGQVEAEICSRAHLQGWAGFGSLGRFGLLHIAQVGFILHIVIQYARVVQRRNDRELQAQNSNKGLGNTQFFLDVVGLHACPVQHRNRLQIAPAVVLPITFDTSEIKLFCDVLVYRFDLKIK